MLLDELSQVAERFGELEQCISGSCTWIRNVFAANWAIVILLQPHGPGEMSDPRTRLGMSVPAN
jgi:hypothetical protein